MSIDSKVRLFLEQIIKNKPDITSKEISSFLNKKGYDISSGTIAAFKANYTRKNINGNT